jgi:hypothetical protein
MSRTRSGADFGPGVVHAPWFGDVNGSPGAATRNVAARSRSPSARPSGDRDALPVVVPEVLRELAARRVAALLPDQSPGVVVEDLGVERVRDALDRQAVLIEARGARAELRDERTGRVEAAAWRFAAARHARNASYSALRE